MTYDPRWFTKPTAPLTTVPLVMEDDGDIVPSTEVSNIGGITFDSNATQPASAEGGVRYDFVTHKLQYHNGTNWIDA